MKSTGTALLSILSVLSLLSAPGSFADQLEPASSGDPSTGAQAQSGAEQLLKGMVGAVGVLSDELQSKLGFQCTATDKQEIIVNDVVPATPAASSGLEVGDRITDAHVDHDILDLGVERDGQPLRFRLNAQTKLEPAPPLTAQMPVSDAVHSPKPFSLNAEQTVRKTDPLKAEAGARNDKNPKIASVGASRFALRVKKDSLSDYRVELIVDRSQSMHRTDCPGGLSRWQWVGMQATNLATSLAPMVPKGLTIVPFATDYDIFEHATARSIAYMFNSINLQFGTRLYEPLAERLDNYFLHKAPDSKPLLIVVITDGEPFPRFEPQMVRNELIAASRRMTSPGDVTVIFCQIGNNDVKGQNYLESLDNDLVSQGARYHFVHTLTFDQVTRAGLGQALTGAIKMYGSTAPNGAPALMTAIPSGPPNFVGGQNFRRPDPILDHAQVGPRGERHYANGKFFDLTQVPVDQAIAVTNRPDPLVREMRNRAMGWGGGQGHGGQRRRNSWAQMNDDDSL